MGTAPTDRGRAVAPPRLAAEVVQLVMLKVLCVQKPPDLVPRIAIHVLNARGGEAVDDDAGVKVREVQGKTVLLHAHLLARHCFSARVKQRVAWKAAAVTAANFVALRS